MNYKRDVPTTIIDVYRICLAFEVTDPCIQHAVKKLLCAGARRGDKSTAQDVGEAIESLKRWQEMRAEDAGAPRNPVKPCETCGGAREVYFDDAGMLARGYMRPCPACTPGTK